MQHNSANESWIRAQASILGSADPNNPQIKWNNTKKYTMTAFGTDFYNY